MPGSGTHTPISAGHPPAGRFPRPERPLPPRRPRVNPAPRVPSADQPRLVQNIDLRGSRERDGK